MATYLDIKEAVAENLGKTDGATPNTKREGAIKRARRKYYGARQWTFCRKVGTAISFTAGVANLPADYNNRFKPLSLYRYDGDIKYTYTPVEWADVDSYDDATYVYAVDLQNGDIKVSSTYASLLIDYTFLPADKTAVDGSQDADVEPAPDTTAIELLATAYFFMSSRQSKGSYQQFLDGYKDQLRQDEQADAKSTPVRLYRNHMHILNKGYHSHG